MKVHTINTMYINQCNISATHYQLKVSKWDPRTGPHHCWFRYGKPNLSQSYATLYVLTSPTFHFSCFLPYFQLSLSLFNEQIQVANTSNSLVATIQSCLLKLSTGNLLVTHHQINHEPVPKGCPVGLGFMKGTG